MGAIDNTSWISSKEILVKTGISRATLNNYIKMGILPKPVVRRTETGQRGSKRIGYFPEGVIERIKMVKRLKREGGSMEEIVRKFKEAENNQNFSDVEISSPHNTADSRADHPSANVPNLSGRIADKGLTLTINDIGSPAYLVNNNLEITWINNEAEDQIFNNKVRSFNDLESRNIFKLFFNDKFRNKFRNWEEIIAFHMPFVKHNFHKNHIPNIYHGISQIEIGILERIYDNTGYLARRTIKNIPIDFEGQDGSINAYQAYSIYFREGIFFVYVPEDRQIDKIIYFLSQRERIINELLKQRMPSLVSLCVLVGDLQDSVKISSELLPGEYFRLINQLWKTLDSSFEKYNGINGKHSGDRIVYYFIRKPGSNYIMNAISCALEVREKVKKFSSEWKLEKGWHNDLYLNIGINEGEEFFGTIRSAANVEFTALGDSINYAGRLSDFARYGAIWTTKNVISKLNQEELNKLRFGVHRIQHGREIFVPNSFSRVIDLLDKEDKNAGKFLDIAALPIAEILS